MRAPASSRLALQASSPWQKAFRARSGQIGDLPHSVARVPDLRRLLPRAASLLIALAGVVYGQSGPFTIPPGALSDGVVTQPYFTSITSSNAVGAITWSVLSGAFPPGLVLNQSAPNTFISGTPTQAGSFTFTIEGVDSQSSVAMQQFSIQINSLLVVTSSTLRNATAGVNYQTTLSATGGVKPYYWYLAAAGISIGAFHRNAISGGVFPPGMTLSTNGTISGVTPNPGTFTFDVYVNDSSSSAPQYISGTITLVVRPAVSITTSTTLPDGVVGIPYSTPLRAQDGIIPYQWAVTTGALPPGLTLAADGSLTGNPTQAGTFPFTAKVTDYWGSTASAPFTVTITQGLAITTVPPLPAGTVGVDYRVTFSATPGNQTFAWSVSAGTLPGGLTLDPVTGLLSGKPTAAGNFPFTIQVTDTAKNTATRDFAITIIAPLAITTTSLPDGTVGVAYTQTVAATGGTGPYEISISGNLPAGLQFDPPTGVIAGKPTKAEKSTFTVQVTDANGATASQELSINVIPALAFQTDSTLPNATGGSAYHQSIKATGGTPPYSFKIDSGSLPAGLTFDAGVVAGTPTALGAFHFVVSVTDASKPPLTLPKAYDLTVAAPTVPPPTIGGVNDTEPPAQQPTLSLELAHYYPLPLNGTMTLTFKSAAGDVDDPAIQFSAGGRTLSFTVPAGETTAVFPGAGISLSTGTVAGTITLTLQFEAGGQDVTPQPAPARVIQSPAQAPVISKVTASRTSTGFEVAVTGFSNSREMVSAAFTFQAAAGTTLQSTQATVTADQIFATWYNDQNSLQFGSQFTFTQPFTVSGNVNGVAGVTVTLTNKQGTSTAATATVQ